MEDRYDRNTTTWGSADGSEFLVKDLSTSHLVNILNWIKTKNQGEKPVYPEALYQFLEEEAALRIVQGFTTNMEIPVKQANGFYVVENQRLIPRLKSLFLQRRARLIIRWTDTKNPAKLLILKLLKFVKIREKR